MTGYIVIVLLPLAVSCQPRYSNLRQRGRIQNPLSVGSSPTRGTITGCIDVRGYRVQVLSVAPAILELCIAQTYAVMR